MNESINPLSQSHRRVDLHGVRSCLGYSHNTKFIDMRKITAAGTLYGKSVYLEQISKPAARKLFCAGEEVYLQSSNMSLINPWQSACPVKVDPEDLCRDAAGQFECIVNSFLSYNCDSERGRYVSFYKDTAG
jgi:hypothetical protein